MADSEWLARLRAASDALVYSAAPDWLKVALRDAVTMAPDLAPREEPQPTPPDFFYPH